MSLYDGPCDVTAHLRQLETRIRMNGFDHLAGKQPNWKNERQLAAQAEKAAKSSGRFRLIGALEEIRSELLKMRKYSQNVLTHADSHHSSSP